MHGEASSKTHGVSLNYREGGGPHGRQSVDSLVSGLEKLLVIFKIWRKVRIGKREGLKARQTSLTELDEVGTRAEVISIRGAKDGGHPVLALVHALNVLAELIEGIEVHGILETKMRNEEDDRSDAPQHASESSSG